MKDKKIFKKSSEELQEYLNLFRRRGFKIPAKCGRGSEYKRSKVKRETYDES